MSYQGTKTVSYGNITALLIEAIKEQNKEINMLKDNNKKLHKVINKLIDLK